MSELNPYVKVEVADGIAADALASNAVVMGCDVVVLSGHDQATLTAVNNACRAKNIGTLEVILGFTHCDIHVTALTAG